MMHTVVRDAFKQKTSRIFQDLPALPTKILILSFRGMSRCLMVFVCCFALLNGVSSDVVHVYVMLCFFCM